MLEMKHTWKAVMTLGLALLLGSGVAYGQTIQLDGVGATAPQPVRLAAETISTAEGNRHTMGTTLLGYNVTLDDTETVLQVTAKAAIPDDYYLRISFDGATLRGTVTAPDITGGGAIGSPVSGGADNDAVVYSLGSGGIALNATVMFTITSNLSVASAEPGTVSAMITAYRDQFDAINGVNALDGQFFGGGATIIEKVSGITAVVSPGTTAVADVGVGFNWFVNPQRSIPGNPRNAETARLGSFLVAERTGTATNAAKNAADGSDDFDLITDASGVTFTIEGDLSIGAFNLALDPDTTDMTVVDGCLATSDGTADNPLRGNVAGTKDMPNTATLSTSQSGTPTFADEVGTFNLCVNVDTMGAMSNDMPIPSTTYTGTITLPGATAAAPGRVLDSGPVGLIRRNGTTVRVAYLTTSPKHNQRLILVNHGTNDASYEIGEFAAEDGVMVEALAGAEGVIPAGGSVVLPARTVLSIDSETIQRTAAVISINADVEDIQVATTQVNLSDSSTDTVIWATEGGAELSVN